MNQNFSLRSPKVPKHMPLYELVKLIVLLIQSFLQALRVQKEFHRTGAAYHENHSNQHRLAIDKLASYAY